MDILQSHFKTTNLNYFKWNIKNSGYFKSKVCLTIKTTFNDNCEFDIQSVFHLLINFVAVIILPSSPYHTHFSLQGMPPLYYTMVHNYPWIWDPCFYPYILYSMWILSLFFLLLYTKLEFESKPTICNS